MRLHAPASCPGGSRQELRHEWPPEPVWRLVRPETLFAIKGVKEAAVVAVPDELLGEAIRAYVVLDEGIALDEADVVRACREHLEAFAVPHEVRFIDELPKTPSGKVRRKSLLEVSSER